MGESCTVLWCSGAVVVHGGIERGANTGIDVEIAFGIDPERQNCFRAFQSPTSYRQYTSQHAAIEDESSRLDRQGIRIPRGISAGVSGVLQAFVSGSEIR